MAKISEVISRIYATLFLMSLLALIVVLCHLVDKQERHKCLQGLNLATTGHDTVVFVSQNTGCLRLVDENNSR